MSSAGSPPVWSSTPAAKPGVPFSKRLESLGSTCFALAIIEILFSAQRIFTASVSESLFNVERSLLPRSEAFAIAAGPTRPLLETMRIWETVRTIPFLIASGILLYIGLRLRKGDARVLTIARRWVAGAFAAIAISLAIQIFVTLPATSAYQSAFLASMPTSATAGFDSVLLKRIASFAVLANVVGSTVVLSVWPIVLLVWSARLMRDAPATT